MASAMFTNALKSFSSPIASNYHEKSATPIGYCGPWKIYDAKKKKTNQPVSIFVFERKSLENGRGGGRGDGLKAAQDEAVERLKKEASLLARLRHPCILELVEPVEETRSGGLQFVTEQVTASLTTLLQEKDDEERSGSQRRQREVEIDELEIQKGLLQIGKALEFLHESANLIHCNLTPDAIIVNAKVCPSYSLGVRRARGSYHPKAGSTAKVANVVNSPTGNSAVSVSPFHLSTHPSLPNSIPVSPPTSNSLSTTQPPT